MLHCRVMTTWPNIVVETKDPWVDGLRTSMGELLRLQWSVVVAVSTAQSDDSSAGNTIFVLRFIFAGLSHKITLLSIDSDMFFPE